MEKELRKLYEIFNNTDDIGIKYYIYIVFSEMIKHCKNNKEIRDMYINISNVCHNMKSEIKSEIIKEKDEKNMFLINNKDLVDLIPDSFYLYDTNFDKKKHSKKGLSRTLENFLSNLSHDFASFYREMVNDGKIIILDQNRKVEQLGFSSTDNSDNFICINKLETLDDMRALIREVGKAYYNHCNNVTLNDMKSLDVNIKSEIPGLWLEMLFHRYCHGYKAVIQEKGKVKKYDDLAQLYSKFVVSFLLISRSSIEIEDMYKYIYETDYRELIGIRKDKSLVK